MPEASRDRSLGTLGPAKHLMWIERSVEEKRAYIAERRRSRVYLAIIATVAVTIAFSLLRSGREAADTARSYFITEISDIPLRVPRAFIGGVFVGVVILLVYGRQSTMICSSCGESKHSDGNLSCACGGHFRDICDIKWNTIPVSGAEIKSMHSTTQAVSPLPKNKNA